MWRTAARIIPHRTLGRCHNLQRFHGEVEECPIYNEFDWNLPGMTILVVLGALLAYLVVAGLYTAFASGRKVDLGVSRGIGLA